MSAAESSQKLSLEVNRTEAGPPWYRRSDPSGSDHRKIPGWHTMRHVATPGIDAYRETPRQCQALSHS